MFTQKPKQDSISTSLPLPRQVRGYEIRRMPIGIYLQAMKALQDFPAKTIAAVFPGMSLEDVLLSLKACDAEMIGQVMIRALSVVPEEVITLLGHLTGIPQEKLMEDEAIGLDGLTDIIAAWLEVNNIENFMNAARSLWANVKGMAAAKTGSRS